MKNLTIKFLEYVTAMVEQKQSDDWTLLDHEVIALAIHNSGTHVLVSTIVAQNWSELGSNDGAWNWTDPDGHVWHYALDPERGWAVEADHCFYINQAMNRLDYIPYFAWEDLSDEEFNEEYTVIPW